MTLRLRKLVSALANDADDHAPSRSLMLQMPLRFSLLAILHKIDGAASLGEWTDAENSFPVG